MEGKSLTRREFEEVIRRASELAAEEPDAGEGALDEAEVLRIAREVGLPERYVRRALSEVRGEPRSRGALDALFGTASIQAGRVVPGGSERLALVLDEFMVAGQLLRPVRKTSSLLEYRPPTDLFSKLARAASARYRLASARRLQVRLDDLEGARSHVEIEVDPGTRGEYVGGAVIAAAVSGGSVVALAAVVAATVAPFALGVGIGVAGAAAGTGIAALVVSAVARAHRRRLEEVKTEIEGVLDRLEAGESPQPPPASWRRWMNRHLKRFTDDLFEGVELGEPQRGPQRSLEGSKRSKPAEE